MKNLKLMGNDLVVDDDHGLKLTKGNTVSIAKLLSSIKNIR